MERKIRINRNLIKIKICIYAVFIAAWLIFVFLTGVFTVVYHLFIILPLALIIKKNISKIRRYDEFSMSEDSGFRIDSVAGELTRTIFAPVIAGLLFVITPVVTIHLPGVISFLPFQYNFSKMYMEEICGAGTELMPEKLPDKILGYDLHYFPGLLQAPSELTLDLKTDNANIEEIEKKAEKLAIGKLDLESFNEDHENQQVLDFIDSYFGPDKNIYPDYVVPKSTGKAGGKKGKGTIYIISANGDWNHRHTESITINYDTCTVSYTY